MEVISDGGPVSSWSRLGALELASGDAKVLVDQRGRLLDWRAGGRVAVRAVVTQNGAPRYSSVELVKIAPPLP